VQGITGRDGAFHTEQMLKYGTRVVAGVTPGKGGEKVHGVPVFDSVADAVAATRANASVIYVPAPFAADAIYEAADAGRRLIVCITEGCRCATRSALAPRRDPLRPTANARRGSSVPTARADLARASKVGDPARPHLHARARRRRVAQRHAHLRGRAPADARGPRPDDVPRHRRRSGDRHQFHRRGDVVRLGPADGSDRADRRDRRLRRGGGGAVHPPPRAEAVVAFVAGQTAPPGKRMGHAGAIISGGSGTAADKMAAFEAAGIAVARIRPRSRR
jgi:succinyl-CoA synthetase alpha subunit